MPNAQPSSPAHASDAPLGAELVLVSVDSPRLSRVSDPSGVRLRPISSLPPPPDAPLSRAPMVLRAGLAIALMLAIGAFARAALGAVVERDLSLTVLLGLGLTALFYLVANVVQALRYQPLPAAARHRLPAITLVVPAFEEGARVRCAIESAIESGYPLDRLEIIAIDDRSGDDTWQHLMDLAESYPDVLKLIRQPRTRGKREALRTGFIRASGAFVITVEPSANVAQGALEALIAPMIADASIAAVAGRVLVANEREGLLTRLLSARLALSFDLTRAAQSLSGAVLSTPLALSAYRTEAVLEVLGPWSSQTFLGRPCTFGEDRALTSELLRAGFRASYQSSAVVRTLAPTTLAGAAELLVRTERSNLREDLLLLPMLLLTWRRDRIWAAMEVLFELAQYPLGWLAMTMLVIEAGAHPWITLGGAMVLLGLALVQNLRALPSPRAADLLAALGLWWVAPASLAGDRARS